MQIGNFLTKGLTTRRTTKLCLGLREQSSQSKIKKNIQNSTLRLPAENNNKYSIFKTRHDQNDDLLRTYLTLKDTGFLVS
jgi:hypothetical protein